MDSRATLAFLLFFNAESSVETTLIFPFFKNINYELGLFYLFTTSLVIVSTSNAVNLSDGLDGLAIMPTVMIGGRSNCTGIRSWQHKFF